MAPGATVGLVLLAGTVSPTTPDVPTRTLCYRRVESFLVSEGPSRPSLGHPKDPVDETPVHPKFTQELSHPPSHPSPPFPKTHSPEYIRLGTSTSLPTTMPVVPQTFGTPVDLPPLRPPPQTPSSTPIYPYTGPVHRNSGEINRGRVPWEGVTGTFRRRAVRRDPSHPRPSSGPQRTRRARPESGRLAFRGSSLVRVTPGRLDPLLRRSGRVHTPVPRVLVYNSWSTHGRRLPKSRPSKRDQTQEKSLGCENYVSEYLVYF